MNAPKNPCKALLPWLFLLSFKQGVYTSNYFSFAFFLYQSSLVRLTSSCKATYSCIVGYCVHLHTHDHTRKPSIGFVYLFMQEGCGFVCIVICCTCSSEKARNASLKVALIILF